MKIKVKQTVLAVASEGLFSYGFEYDKEQSSPKNWVFSRRNESIREFIAFELSDHYENSIRMRLSNSRDPIGIEARGLLNDSKPWCQYQDEKSLGDIVQKFLNVFCERGQEWFRLNSIPIPRIPQDILSYLVDNSGELSASFCERFSLNLEEPESLKKVEMILLEKRSQLSFGDIDLDLVMAAAAYLGEMIRGKFGGEWVLEQEFNRVKLAGIGGGNSTVSNGFSSLTFVLRFWYRYPFAQGIYSAFKSFESRFC